MEVRITNHPTVNFSHLEGASVATKQLKEIVIVFLEEEPGHCPKAALLFLLTAPIYSPHPFPSLVSSCLNLWLELRKDPGSWMKPISRNQEMGDTKVFVSRSPTGSCLLSRIKLIIPLHKQLPSPCTLVNNKYHTYRFAQAISLMFLLSYLKQTSPYPLSIYQVFNFSRFHFLS